VSTVPLLRKFAVHYTITHLFARLGLHKLLVKYDVFIYYYNPPTTTIWCKDIILYIDQTELQIGKQLILYSIKSTQRHHVTYTDM